MTDPTLSTGQMEDLTRALTTLLPALLRLEASLKKMDESAPNRQAKLAETLDRIASALEAMPENRKTFLAAMSAQREQTEALAKRMDILVTGLQAERTSRMGLEASINRLTRLLAGPA